MKPHKHAELIKLWADGNKIQWRGSNNDMEWMDIAPIWWDEDKEYRVKPAAPKWPQTTMTQDDLWSQIDNVRNAPTLEAFANMVIARSCEDGHVVPADKVREIEAKARAEGIKEGSKQLFYTAGVLPSLLDIHGASLHFKVPK